MARSNRNLLEAFRDAGSSKPLGSQKPAAPPPVRDSGADRPPPPPRARAPRSDGGLPMALLLLIFVAVFALGVLTGRSGLFGGAVAAGGPEDGDGGKDSAATPAWIEPGTSAQADGANTEPGTWPPVESRPAVKTPEQALLDRTNRYSAIAIYYLGQHEANQQRAREVITHLRNQGFPSAVAYNYKDGIYVFVGASPERAVIDGIARRLQGTPGPRGKMDFLDAYTVNIDDHIKRD